MTPKIIEALKEHRGPYFVMIWLWLLIRTIVGGSLLYKAIPLLETTVLHFQ